MNIEIDPAHLLLIQKILRTHGIAPFTFAFGSRVKGNHRRYSDLDLVVKMSEPLDGKVLARVKDDFETSELPITVDLIEWSKISEEFRAKIETDLIKVVSE